MTQSGHRPIRPEGEERGFLGRPLPAAKAGGEQEHCRTIPLADINAETKQRRYTASKGTSSAKLLPVVLAGFVSSAPNCSDNAETSRVPKRLLFAKSKPAGNPTPSSRIDMATARFSIWATVTQMGPPLGRSGYAYLPALETSSLIISPIRIARSAKMEIFGGATKWMTLGEMARSRSLSTSFRYVIKSIFS